MKATLIIALITFILVSGLSIASETDYIPVMETVNFGTTAGFGLLEDNDALFYTIQEDCSIPPCLLNVTHDWEDVAFGTLEYVEMRVRAYVDGTEAIIALIYDWQDGIYAQLLEVSSTTEELYVRSLDFTCGSGGADCFVNPDRNGAAVSILWIDLGQLPDVVQSTLTVDQEILRVVRTDKSSNSDEWNTRIGFTAMVIFLLIGVFGDSPLFVFMAGVSSLFLSFSAFSITEQVWTLVLFLILGIALIILAAYMMMTSEEGFPI